MTVDVLIVKHITNVCIRIITDSIRIQCMYENECVLVGLWNISKKKIIAVT